MISTGRLRRNENQRGAKTNGYVDGFGGARVLYVYVAFASLLMRQNSFRSPPHTLTCGCVMMTTTTGNQTHSWCFLHKEVYYFIYIKNAYNVTVVFIICTAPSDVNVLLPNAVTLRNSSRKQCDSPSPMQCMQANTADFIMRHMPGCW